MPIGAHVSIAGKIYEAIPRAQVLGCECLQIFYGSPRQWRLVSYPPEDLAEFRRRRAEAGLDPLVAHAPYLVNLGSADPRLRQRSIAALAHALQGMDALQGLGVITHVGSAMGRPWPEARARVARAIRSALKESARASCSREARGGASAGPSRSCGRSWTKRARTAGSASASTRRISSQRDGISAPRPEFPRWSRRATARWGCGGCGRSI